MSPGARPAGSRGRVTTVSRMRITCGRYDRTAALADGRVSLPGFDLDVDFANAPQCFRSVLQPSDSDVSEMSFSYYAVSRDRGDDSWQALPVFLSRSFRHSSLYVRATDRRVHFPQALAGGRIGLVEYHMTAAVWVRALLEEDFGVRAEDVEWVIGPVAGARREPMQAAPTPAEVAIRDLDGYPTLTDALMDGYLDAIIAPAPPPGARGSSPTIVPLWRDWPEREREYHRRTGHFPIMHLVVVRSRLLDRHPGLAAALFEMFSRARDVALADLALAMAPALSVPFLQHAVEWSERAFGDDLWSYGVENNENTIRALQGYLHRQGITKGVLPLDSFFAAIR